MDGPRSSGDARRWLDEPVAVLHSGQQSLLGLADAVAARLREHPDDEEEARLRSLAVRLGMALRHTESAVQALLSSPGDKSGQEGSREREAISFLEEEQYRLARDVHDGPAQVLSNSILTLRYCERLAERDPAALKAELAQLREGLQQGLAEVRRLVFDLHPPALVESGLLAALRDYLPGIGSSSGPKTELAVLGDEGRLPAAQEVAAFRIVQEALQNARRHARARRVTVEVETGPAEWRLRVRDDGVGFDPAAGTRGGPTLGLTGMRERAKAIGARLEVVSAPGKGTTVALTVPVADSWGEA